MGEPLDYQRLHEPGPPRYVVFHQPSGTRLGEVMRLTDRSRVIWHADKLLGHFERRCDAGAALFKRERDRTRGW